MTIEQLYSIFRTHPVVFTDTRNVKPGGIFFALKGDRFNGNLFAGDALAAGAAYAVIDEPGTAVSDRCLLVDNVLTTLQALAHYHRTRFAIPFIAITGSNGKTTTKELVAAVLSKRLKTYATKGNLNNHIGIPLTLLSIAPDAGMAIIEMGANHRGEIAAYCKIATPDYGIITNCGKAHIEGFGGEEGVRKGKGELYDYLRASGGAIFRNEDLDYLAGMAAGIKEQYTYGTTGNICSGKPLMKDDFLTVRVDHDHTVYDIDTRLVGDYNFPNVMTAVAVGLHFGLNMQEIKAAIEAYAPDNSRSQMLINGTNQIILDAYNANPNSMAAAITNFAGSPSPDRILWLGGMREMGADERKEHETLLALVNSYDWKDVILVGREFERVPHPYKWFATSAEASDYVRAHRPENSAILIKGSRGSKMEVLLEALSD